MALKPKPPITLAELFRLAFRLVEAPSDEEPDFFNYLTADGDWSSAMHETDEFTAKGLASMLERPHPAVLALIELDDQLKRSHKTDVGAAQNYAEICGYEEVPGDGVDSGWINDPYGQPTWTSWSLAATVMTARGWIRRHEIEDSKTRERSMAWMVATSSAEIMLKMGVIKMDLESSRQGEVDTSLATDADREMIGDDVDFGIEDVGAK